MTIESPRVVGVTVRSERSMLRLPAGTRIFMAVERVDMRRSFDGHCATICEALGSNPLSGDLLLFRGKRADRIRAIIWDRNGLSVWYKRLELGSYRWPSREAASIDVSEHELTLLLAGVDFTCLRRLPPFSVHTPPP